MVILNLIVTCVDLKVGFLEAILNDYDYYWRVEPDIKLYCDIDYDIFKWMKDNNKDYAFTISLPEYKETIPTLWDTTKNLLKKTHNIWLKIT